MGRGNVSLMDLCCHFLSAVMNVSYAVHELNVSAIDPLILADASTSSSNHLFEILIFAVIVSCATITAVFCCIEWYKNELEDRKLKKELDDGPSEAKAHASKISVHSASPRMTTAHSCTCQPGFECEDLENCMYPMGLDLENEASLTPI